MTITIICWSHRNVGSYKAANFVEARLTEKWINTNRINLSEANIPLWTQERRDAESDVSKNILAPIRTQLAESDGFVIISPERSGMAAPWLKNFFLIASKQHEFAHKAALLIWVSAGTGWAYPIAELRISSYKNTKICYLPDHVIITDVDNVLDDHVMNQEADDFRIKSRIDRSLDMLLEYTKSLTDMRNTSHIDLMKHANGM